MCAARPDGYGCHRRGNRFGFFPQFDRGTGAGQYAAVRCVLRTGTPAATDVVFELSASSVVTTSVAAVDRLAHAMELAARRHSGLDWTILMMSSGIDIDDALAPAQLT